MQEIRQTPGYQKKKMAWELVNSPMWTEYLLGLLEKKTVEMPQSFGSLEDFTKKLSDTGKCHALNGLRKRIEKDAKDFVGESRL